MASTAVALNRALVAAVCLMLLHSSMGQLPALEPTPTPAPPVDCTSYCSRIVSRIAQPIWELIWLGATPTTPRTSTAAMDTAPIVPALASPVTIVAAALVIVHAGTTMPVVAAKSALTFFPAHTFSASISSRGLCLAA